VFLSDGRSPHVVHLFAKVSGDRYDALSRGIDAQKEDVSWNGAWQSAVTANEKAFTVEMAIPWKTLAEAGLDRSSLGVNLMTSGPFRTSEALRYLGCRGRDRSERFVPLALGKAADAAPRPFTVRLHFAELDDVRPGQRVFHVKLQGRTVLRGLDVAQEAGVQTALVKEFEHVPATDALTLEFIPAGSTLRLETVPILNGLELREEAE